MHFVKTEDGLGKQYDANDMIDSLTDLDGHPLLSPEESTMMRVALLLLVIAAIATAQQSGGQKKNAHPQMSWQQCTKAAGCTVQQGAISIDSNWDWTHKLVSCHAPITLLRPFLP